MIFARPRQLASIVLGTALLGLALGLAIVHAQAIDRQDVLVYAGDGTRLLTPTQDGYHVLAGKRYVVGLNDTDASAISNATLTVAGQTYLLSDESGAGVSSSGRLSGPVTRRTFGHVAYLIAPDAGIYPARVRIAYPNGTTDVFPLTIVSEPLGQVRSSGETAHQPIADAPVELFRRDGLSWTAWTPDAGEENPTRTDASGAFGWYVENGTYDVRVTAAGYPETRTGPFEVTDQLVRPEVTLTHEVPSLVWYQTSVFAEQLAWILPLLALLLFLAWRSAMKRAATFLAAASALGVLILGLFELPLHPVAGMLLFLLSALLLAIDLSAHGDAP